METPSYPTKSDLSMCCILTHNKVYVKYQNNIQQAKNISEASKIKIYQIYNLKMSEFLLQQ